MHRRTSSGRWTCHVCGTCGPDGVTGFDLHYLTEHYGTTSKRRDPYPRQGTTQVREMRDLGRPEVEHPSQETPGHGRIERPDDVITGEPDPPLW